MTDYAKEPQPERQGLTCPQPFEPYTSDELRSFAEETRAACATGGVARDKILVLALPAILRTLADWVGRTTDGDQITQPTTRIALVDGATTTPLSAEALVVALFASLPSQVQAGVLQEALAIQGQLERTQQIQIQVNRVLRPST